MLFGWDEQKNKTNIEKHGVSFEQAKEVFSDPLHLAVLDFRYSYFEERWITIGSTVDQQLLVVANLFFTDEGEEMIRIISARKATVHERGSMKKPEQRAALDEFELADEYDFSGAVRGRFYKSHKVAATLDLDDDLFLFLKKKAAEEHLDFHFLVNRLLRQSIHRA